jgi:hypothetical protein
MRVLTLLFFAQMFTSAQDSKILKAHQWKHRLVIAHVVDADARAVAESWKQAQDGATMRHLKLVDVSAEPIQVDGSVRPDKAEMEVVRGSVGIESPDQSVFVLVGKDGGIKARQQGKLDLNAFFALIDAMPMRQREMRARQ